MAKKDKKDNPTCDVVLQNKDRNDPVLERIRVEGFKRVQDVSLSLANVNILVGANGSGKSSVLQALHLACCVMRQAAKVGDTSSTITTEELDYLPTENYETLGHGTNWGNTQSSPNTKVTLSFLNEENSSVGAHCTLRSARNSGISITGSISPELQQLRRKEKFFSAYIPGISGLPNKEERRSRKVLLKACSYGDSNIILRNALLLLKEHKQDKEKGRENIRLIEKWIGEIICPIVIHVNHDDDSDLYISCDLQINGKRKPIELAGTGYVQLIQIFCYILLFDPSLLLIDEPDIHLYPEIQEKLVSVLGRIASERNIKILLATHSPFIVRGAPADANVYWLKDGVEESRDRDLIEATLGWGAFGKSIIIASEDKDTILLRAIISQWPEIDRKIAFLPGSGYKNLLSPEQARELTKTLGGKFKLLVHRDRDSLTDKEVEFLQESYRNSGAELWLPQESDIESYFCHPEFIRNYCHIDISEAESLIARILDKDSSKIRDQFDKQRKAHNAQMYPEGGSPFNETVWSQFQNRAIRGAKGKYVFGQLKSIINKNFSEKDIAASLSKETSIAADLKDKINLMLSS